LQNLKLPLTLPPHHAVLIELELHFEALPPAESSQYPWSLLESLRNCIDFAEHVSKSDLLIKVSLTAISDRETTRTVPLLVRLPDGCLSNVETTIGEQYYDETKDLFEKLRTAGHLHSR
jgi:hypothetical protein